jgi:hypothetical protein
MINDSKRFVTIFVISNTVVISADTITQILHYSLTQWYTEEAKNLALLFILFRPVLLFCMFFTYAILHYERMLTCSKKIITLFLFLFSMYAGYSPGVHLSFYSKYYLESENGIVVCKIVNTFSFIFVALPKILIIPINNSSAQSWLAIDIIALIFSCIFIIWSIAYYIVCGLRDFDFEIEMEDMSKLWEIEGDSEQRYADENYNKDAKPDSNSNDQEKNVQKSDDRFQNDMNHNPYVNAKQVIPSDIEKNIELKRISDHQIDIHVDPKSKGNESINNNHENNTSPSKAHQSDSIAKEEFKEKEDVLPSRI